MAAAPRLVLGRCVRLASLGDETQRARPLYLARHPLCAPACDIWQGYTAHPHAWLAWQFPRLCGHAADAPRLRRSHTFLARIWIFAASTQGRRQLSLRRGALASAHVRAWVFPLCCERLRFWSWSNYVPCVRSSRVGDRDTPHHTGVGPHPHTGRRSAVRY